jgi:hypothetical protein
VVHSSSSRHAKRKRGRRAVDTMIDHSFPFASYTRCPNPENRLSFVFPFYFVSLPIRAGEKAM